MTVNGKKLRVPMPRLKAGEMIVDVVAAYTGVSREEMESGDRGAHISPRSETWQGQRISSAKALAVAACRNWTTMSYPEIAREIGFRGHSSAVEAHQRVRRKEVPVVPVVGDDPVPIDTALSVLASVLFPDLAREASQSLTRTTHPHPSKDAGLSPSTAHAASLTGIGTPNHRTPSHLASPVPGRG